MPGVVPWCLNSQSMSTSCPPSCSAFAYRCLPRPTAAHCYHFCSKDPPLPEGWRDAAHWEFDYSERSPPDGTPASQCSLCVLRGKRWKYVQFADNNMPPLLFDIQADPGEMCNLAASSAIEHVEARADCAAQMLRWRMQHAEHTLTHSVEKGLLIMEPKL